MNTLLPCHFEKHGFKIFSVSIFRVIGINPVHNSAKRTSASDTNRTVVSRTTALRQFRIWRHTRKRYQKTTLKEPRNCETMQLRKTCKVTSFFIRTRPYLTGKHRICLSSYRLVTRQDCETGAVNVWNKPYSGQRLLHAAYWNIQMIRTVQIRLIVRDWLSVSELKSPPTNQATKHVQILMTDVTTNIKALKNIESDQSSNKNLLCKNVRINTQAHRTLIGCKRWSLLTRISDCTGSNAVSNRRTW